MATSDSREVVIEASPEEILDVIADVESTPSWSSQYQSAEVLDSYDDGRPKRVKMKVKAAGLTDEQVVEYTWTETSASWTLVSAGQLKAEVRDHRRPVGAPARIHPQASDEGRDGDGHRRPAQAGAKDQEGWLSSFVSTLIGRVEGTRSRRTSTQRY
jgi:hypothetical protein